MTAFPYWVDLKFSTKNEERLSSHISIKQRLSILTVTPHLVHMCVFTTCPQHTLCIYCHFPSQYHVVRCHNKSSRVNTFLGSNQGNVIFHHQLTDSSAKWHCFFFISDKQKQLRSPANVTCVYLAAARLWGVPCLLCCQWDVDETLPSLTVDQDTILCS